MKMMQVTINGAIELRAVTHVRDGVEYPLVYSNERFLKTVSGIPVIYKDTAPPKDVVIKKCDVTGGYYAERKK